MKIDPMTPDGAILAELGRRLQQLRKLEGWTQQELATEAGIGVATLRRIEDGSDSQLGSWLKILKALGRAPTIDGLLPEDFPSPMEAALGDKARGKRRGRGDRSDSRKPFRWGDGGA